MVVFKLYGTEWTLEEKFVASIDGNRSFSSQQAKLLQRLGIENFVGMAWYVTEGKPPGHVRPTVPLNMASTPNKEKMRDGTILYAKEADLAQQTRDKQFHASLAAWREEHKLSAMKRDGSDVEAFVAELASKLNVHDAAKVAEWERDDRRKIATAELRTFRDLTIIHRESQHISDDEAAARAALFAATCDAVRLTFKAVVLEPGAALERKGLEHDESAPRAAVAKSESVEFNALHRAEVASRGHIEAAEHAAEAEARAQAEAADRARRESEERAREAEERRRQEEHARALALAQAEAAAAAAAAAQANKGGGVSEEELRKIIAALRSDAEERDTMLVRHIEAHVHANVQSLQSQLASETTAVRDVLQLMLGQHADALARAAVGTAESSEEIVAGRLRQLRLAETRAAEYHPPDDTEAGRKARVEIEQLLREESELLRALLAAEDEEKAADDQTADVGADVARSSAVAALQATHSHVLAAVGRAAEERLAVAAERRALEEARAALEAERAALEETKRLGLATMTATCIAIATVKNGGGIAAAHCDPAAREWPPVRSEVVATPAETHVRIAEATMERCTVSGDTMRFTITAPWLRTLGETLKDDAAALPYHPDVCDAIARFGLRHGLVPAPVDEDPTSAAANAGSGWHIAAAAPLIRRLAAYGSPWHAADVLCYEHGIERSGRYDLALSHATAHAPHLVPVLDLILDTEVGREVEFIASMIGAPYDDPGHFTRGVLDPATDAESLGPGGACFYYMHGLLEESQWCRPRSFEEPVPLDERTLQDLQDPDLLETFDALQQRA